MFRSFSSKQRGIVVLTLILAIVVGLFVNSGGAKAQTNWILQWSDEFNGTAGTGVNTSDWKYDLGTGFGTGEIETMTNSTANVFQDGTGHLVIKAIRDGGGNWTSGRIETQRADFQPPAGGMMRIESSIQQPNVSGAAAAGYWPAFWMLGATLRSGGTWPGVGEWDVMEDINGLSSVFGTLHCGVNPGGPCNESTGKGSGQRACSGCQTGFHTYAIEYDKSTSPEQLRWYLDGTNYFTINSSQLDATTWNNATHRANFIIYDLAMGGGFPAAFGGGPTSSTQSGASMVIDYMRVYYANGPGATFQPPTNTPRPTNTPAPGCGTTNLALNHPATSSSNENGGTTSNLAVDGNTGTRWSSAFSDPQWLQVDLGSTQSICKVSLIWEAAYGKSYQIQTSNDANTWTTIYSTTTGAGGTENLNISGSGRFIRMYGTARGTPYGYSLWEFQVYGGTASCGTTNLALNHPATSSSNENGGTTSNLAVDGNTGTRWSSAFSDPQWLQVDLGSTQSICKVTLIWEAAYGKSYQIQTSNDANTWTTIYSTTSGTGGTENLNVSGSGRFIRMYGTARGTPYGYSLWEFQVY